MPKFRIWIKDEKRMDMVCAMRWDLETREPEQVCCLGHRKWYSMDKVILMRLAEMQCQGKELFEGDKVIYQSNRGNTSGTYKTVMYVPEYAQYAMRDIYDNNSQFSKTWLMDSGAKITGNIYEG